MSAERASLSAENLFSNQEGGRTPRFGGTKCQKKETKRNIVVDIENKLDETKRLHLEKKHDK